MQADPLAAPEIERMQYRRLIVWPQIVREEPQPEPEECWPPLHRFALIVGVSGALWATGVTAGVWVFRALIGG